MALLDGIKKTLKMCGHAFTITVHDRLETMEQRQAETDNVLLRASLRLAEQCRRSGRYEVLASEDPKTFQPALALAQYLYSMFPTHGAHVSCGKQAGASCDEADWNRELPKLGYALTDPGEEPLAIARRCGEIDTEDLRAAVLVADLEAAAGPRVAAMRDADYHWYIVIEQPSSGEAGRFYANSSVILPQWRGHTIFFRSHTTFLHALEWCSAVLRQVYFGPAEESD